MTNDELLHKWVEQTITSEELNIFKQRPEFRELTQLYADTENLQAPAFDGESMLSEILSHQKSGLTEESDSDNKAGPVTRRLWLRIAAAASLLIIPAYFLLLSGGSMTHELREGKTLAGVLPDQSTYFLTGPAILSYKKGMKGSRKVKLEGRAEFKVETGNPFIVSTSNGRVEVLGTTFEVESKEKELHVSCSEGRVAVHSIDETYREELEANEELRLIDSKEAYTWKLNNTKLKNVALEKALAELKKRYKIEFESGSINLSERLSCNFTHNDLNRALKTTLVPLGIKYTQSGNRVILTE